MFDKITNEEWSANHKVNYTTCNTKLKILLNVFEESSQRTWGCNTITSSEKPMLKATYEQDRNTWLSNNKWYLCFVSKFLTIGYTFHQVTSLFGAKFIWADRSKSRMKCEMSDEVLSCVMPYIHDPKGPDAVSLVCRGWYDLDTLVMIALCYTTSPDRLRPRFPHLESLKLKRNPRASMFNLIPKDWGGYVTLWTNAIVKSFNCVKFLHFRRMIGNDFDLDLLSSAHGGVLLSFQPDKCSGFSTDVLLQVTQLCRILRTLFFEKCTIDDKDGQWLHEFASHNPILEVLNFYMMELSNIN